MTLTFLVFILQSIAGVIGICFVLPRPGVIPPSTRNIDHPSKPWRIFYRVMAICMCNLWACLLVLILLANLNTDGLSDVSRALLQLTGRENEANPRPTTLNHLNKLHSLNLPWKSLIHDHKRAVERVL